MNFNWGRISFAEMNAIGLPCIIDGDNKTVEYDVDSEQSETKR